MTDRGRLERVLRSVYAARIRGDLDEVMSHFTEGAHYALLGSSAASPVPTSATGTTEIRRVMQALIAAFEFVSAEPLELIIDGDHGRAAVHMRVHVRVRATGREAETDLLDLIELDGERIASIRQFADTALAAQLLAA